MWFAHLHDTTECGLVPPCTYPLILYNPKIPLPGDFCKRLLQLFIRSGYSYSFFIKAIEDAALRIDDSPLEEETKAYALFFLNVAYIDIPKAGKEETFDFMLKRIKGTLPIDLQLALGHEGKNIKERTALMRKQDRRLRRILPHGATRDLLNKNLYERPVNLVVEQSLKAQERKK